MSDYTSHLREVEQILRRRRNSPNAISHVYKTDMTMYWVPMPEQRKIAKKGFSFTQKLDNKELNRTWYAIWKNSKILEVKTQAILYYDQLKTEDDFAKFFPVLKKYAKDLENWMHSDLLSDLYARMLERGPQKVFPTLKKWNVSKRPWERRQSLVSLLFYQRQRKSYPSFETIAEFLQNCLADDNYYVQKGVGWTLREAEQVYPKETQKFLSSHVQDISSIAFTAASEKLERGFKERLKYKRKNRG